ncbi:MAG: hypothetical protein KGL58_04285 [Pseudomonadota bacterium]|nr:hypothetical protein [Pseudomonadota bacterium]
MDFGPLAESEAGEKNGRERAKGGRKRARWPAGEVQFSTLDATEIRDLQSNDFHALACLFMRIRPLIGVAYGDFFF